MDAIVECVAALEELDLAVCPQEEIEDNANKFLTTSNYMALGYGLNPRNTWYRARLLGTDGRAHDSLRQLIYRDPPGDEFGRMHYPGQRVLYGAWNPVTAFAEIEPVVGQLVQFIEFRSIPGAREVPGILIGAYESFYNAGRIHYPSVMLERHLHDYFARAQPNEWAAAVYADSYLARMFRKQGEHQHRLTSAFVQRLFRATSPTAIVYPSVRISAANNIAMRAECFDSRFEVVCVQVVRVVRNYDNRVIQTALHRKSRSFNPDGTINWDSPVVLRDPTFDFMTGAHYPPGAPSWRVPPK